MNYVLETPFIISLYTVQNVFSYTLPLCKALKTIDCDHVCALNHIIHIMVRLRDVRDKLQDTFHDMYELASRKVKSLGTELKRPRSTSKQTHRNNKPAQCAEEY